MPILVVTSDARAAELTRSDRRSDAVLVAGHARTVLADTTVLIDGSASHERVTVTESETAAAPPPNRGRRLSKSFARVSTVRPPLEPPAALCPLCDRRLTYRHSHIGGVSEQHREQWDWYVCPSCGTFEYRHRTRRLRHVSEGVARR